MNPLGLTDREVLIVWAWSNGRDNAWIAEFTGRSEATIQEQAKHLRQRVGARGTTNAVAIVLRAILRPPSAPAADGRPVVSMQQLAHGARMAVRAGVDPWLALSYVMWPPESLKVAA